MTRRPRWTSKPWWAGLALLLLVAAGGTIYLTTRAERVNLHGAVRLVAADVDWSYSGTGACEPINGATSVAGAQVEITTLDGRPRGSFVVAPFVGAEPGKLCWAPFRDLSIDSSADVYLVKVGSLPAARMTRDQLIAAESPDAYAGIVFLISDCRTRCTVSVKTAVELGGG